MAHSGSDRLDFGHMNDLKSLVGKGAGEDPMKAEVVKMRYFVGLKHREIADALGVSEPTIRRHWAAARIRLFELIAQRPAPS